MSSELGRNKIDLENFGHHQIELTDETTVFGSPDYFKTLPSEHKDQIIFLNEDAGDFLWAYLKSARLLDAKGELRNGENTQLPYTLHSPPFSAHFYKTKEEIEPTDSKDLKKWLFNRKISFDTKVFILPFHYTTINILTTWKMVIKYSSQILNSDSCLVLDKTLNWYLYNYHRGKKVFGKNYIYDPEIGYNEVQEINELKKQYPNIKFPF